MKKKAIIFDMDGVLVDSENAYLNLFRDFLAKAPERDQRRHSTENRRRRYPYDLNYMSRLWGLRIHQNIFASYSTVNIPMRQSIIAITFSPVFLIFWIS